MLRVLQPLLFIACLLLASQARALALGPEDFAAAKQLTCVLAQESLGYLSDEDFASLTNEVLEDYDASQSDVVYAKALGYFDGLMFGLPEADAAVINQRLRSFLESQACTRLVGVSLSL